MINEPCSSLRSLESQANLSLPLDRQLEPGRPGVAGPATGRRRFGTGVDTDKLPCLCAFHPTGLIKGHIGPTLKYRKRTRTASVGERDAEAVPTRRAPPNGPREPAGVRGLTVSTPVVPKDLTVSATMPLLGADGISAVCAPGLTCRRRGVFQAPEADTVGTGADAATSPRRVPHVRCSRSAYEWLRRGAPGCCPRGYAESGSTRGMRWRRSC